MVKMALTSSFGIFGAEEITSDIINNHTDSNVILCSSPKDTIGVAQMAVDHNKVELYPENYLFTKHSESFKEYIKHSNELNQRQEDNSIQIIKII